MVTPDIVTLGKDLLTTTRYQRWSALARPYVGLSLYVLAAYYDIWWSTPFIVFAIFLSVVTVTHDVVHGSLGLNHRQSDWALFLMGAVLLESGHAYRTTHLQHHRNFPDHEDPEGDPARMSFWQSVLHGPVFLFKLYIWSVKKVRKGSGQYYWIIAEGLWFIVWITIGVILLPYTFAILWYIIMVIVGSWVYPLLTVYLPHFDYGETAITQTRSLRGRVIPSIFLELTYHLEHHLYPQVPSHNLRKLSTRLDPFLKQHGAKLWKVL
jgi:beta-carotene hydroxylase